MIGMENASRAVAPARYAELPKAEIAALAKRWRRANGPVISALNLFTGKIEDKLSLVPEAIRARIEAVTAAALESAYGLAGKADGIERGSYLAAMASGAAGGFGGMATSLAELPVSITVLMHAIRLEAKKAGFDPDEPLIQAECLRCFAAGAPGGEDDGIDTAFLSARMALNGPALQKIISTVAPKFAMAFSQKLAAQAVPVLGALTGAALNAAFLRYYTQAAAVRFELLRLGQLYGHSPVRAAFAKATGQKYIQ